LSPDGPSGGGSSSTRAAEATPPRLPILAFTQGDPAGVGPEILLKLLTPLAADPTVAADGANPASRWKLMRERIEAMKQLW